MTELSYFNKNLERLVRLCKLPGWKAWAWHEAKAFENSDPALKGIQKALTERMLEEKETTR